MSNALDQIQTPIARGDSQATLIEQSRAVAEVAAAVRVAKDYPRNEHRAWEQMRQSCGTLALAKRAYYRVPNRGEGPSVHLARELARCFGNIQHGIIELRRDDEAGVSEVQAFAWDVENNTRSVRSFIVPHMKTTGKGASKSNVKILDLTDIVNNNNNVGSRAVREVIFTVLPDAFVDEATRLCFEALQRGDGQPFDQRIEQMVAAYGRAKITQQQLEGKVGRPRAEWDDQDFATLSILFESLRNGDARKDEEFPNAGAAPVTAAEITGGQS